MVVIGVFAAEAIVPAVLIAFASESSHAPWTVFDGLRFVLALGLVRRWRLARIVAQALLGYELLLGVLMAWWMLVVRSGSLYAGFTGTWLYTQSPAVALPVGVVLFALNYWQWRALGRTEVRALFRPPLAAQAPSSAVPGSSSRC